MLLFPGFLPTRHLQWVLYTNEEFGKAKSRFYTIFDAFISARVHFAQSRITQQVITSTGLSASHLVTHHSQKRQALHNVYLILSWRLLHWPHIKPALAERLLSLEKHFTYYGLDQSTAITFRQTAETAYFRSTQLLLFVFARQRIVGDKLLLIKRCMNGHFNKRRYLVVLQAKNV